MAVKVETTELDVDKLILLADNPRRISDKDFEKLKKSIQDFPEMRQLREIVVDENMNVLAGNQRLKALRALGIKTAPVKIVTGLSETKKREFVIKDNVQLGEWDFGILQREWKDDALFDWGLEQFKPTQEIIEDTPPSVDEQDVRSRKGAIYALGQHRLYCGSFEDESSVTHMFNGELAACAFTDPPYNVGYTQKDKDHKGRKILNDLMPKDKFQEFLTSALAAIKLHTEQGAGVICWMSDTELYTLFKAFYDNAFNVKTTITWVKNHFTLGRGDFQSQKEPAIYGINEGKYTKAQDGEDSNDRELAIYARGSGSKFTENRSLSNVWFFDAPLASKEHPTMKPIGLCAKGVLALSEPGDIVYDPFLGSGSTLIACEQIGRSCYGSELDPMYCDVIRKRYWRFVTGSEDGWEEGTGEIE